MPCCLLAILNQYSLISSLNHMAFIMGNHKQSQVELFDQAKTACSF
jgi:hypothetical protein